MSYKPVICTFAAVGLLGAIGLGAAFVKGMQTLSNKSGMIAPYSLTPSVINLNDNTNLKKDFNAASIAPATSSLDTSPRIVLGVDTDRYNAIEIPYTSLGDSSVILNLKLPKELDFSLRSDLTQKGTTLKEIYRSDKHQAFEMTFDKGSHQTIIILDLQTGEMYDTEIEAEGHYRVAGPYIVYLGYKNPYNNNAFNLNQAYTYEIETDETYHEAQLPRLETYTGGQADDLSLSPVTTMVVNGDQVDVTVYSVNEQSVRGTMRNPVRVISYPPAE